MPSRANPVQDQRWLHTIRAALLAFFDAHARPLPWREDGDPYRVWVSEIMLQQTRVAAVLPYYERWMQRFPSLHALAGADVDDVLKAWEGLGYYSRARNLHAAARIVCDNHAGRVPDEYASLRTLPGIGDYTAGAIASVVYGRAEPAVDGNVRRVLTRLLDRDLDTRTLRATAAALVPSDRPGDFNQALMELGATVCTPRAPRCAACPLTNQCAARQNGTQAERPSKKVKGAVALFDVGVAVLRDRRGRILLVRRPNAGLLAGMWELPARIAAPGEAPEDAALQAARRVVGRDDVALQHDEPIATVRHPFSHRTEQYHAYEVAGTFAVRATSRRRWFEPAVRASFTIPRAQQRLLAAVT